MTKREYLNRLEGCLQCVDKGEREAALRYYEEYFDDAGAENEQAVIAELGSPEALARQIIREAGAERAQASAQESYNPTGSPMEFRGIRADLTNANFTILLGNSWNVALDYPEGRPLPEVRLADGVLKITEEKLTSFRIFSWGRQGGWRPGRIEITVPDVEFDTIHVENVNGAAVVPALRMEELYLESVNGGLNAAGVSAQKIYCETVNGGISLNGCTAGNQCHCETVNGSVAMGGALKGRIHAEAVNGSVTVNTTLPLSAYDAQLETVSGSVRINGEKQRKETRVRSNISEHFLHAETVNGSINANFGV